MNGAVQKAQGRSGPDFTECLNESVDDGSYGPPISQDHGFAIPKPAYGHPVSAATIASVRNHHLRWRGWGNSPHAVECECAEPYCDRAWAEGKQAEDCGTAGSLRRWEVGRTEEPYVNDVPRRGSPTSRPHSVPCHRARDAELPELSLGKEALLVAGKGGHGASNEWIVDEENVHRARA